MSYDETEAIRRRRLALINRAVKSHDERPSASGSNCNTARFGMPESLPGNLRS